MKTPYRIPPSELESDRPPPKVERPLGEHLSTHAPRHVSGSIVLGVFFFVIYGVMLTLGIHGATLFGIAAAGSILLSMANAALIRLRPTAEIWDRGIVIRRAWTEQRVIRFEEIDSIHYDPSLTVFPFYRRLDAMITIKDKEGSRAVLPSGLVDTPSIIRALDRNVTRHLLAPAKRALANGELLYFDTVVVQKDELRVEKEKLPLDRLDCVEVVDGQIRFYQKDTNWPPFATVPLETVPHPKVLLAVLGTRVPVEDNSGL